METLAAQPLYAEAGFDRNKRAYNDMTTLLAEAVDGHMRTPFEYSFDGHDLIADDGSCLSAIFDNSLAEADQIAADNPDVAFERRRRQLERDEFDDMTAMARGELPNTMVVVSDFPAELMNAPEDIGRYNVTRKQTMLRVLAWRDGRMKMYSQSLDRSDRGALERIYGFFGRQPQDGELLGQRTHVDLSSEEQMLLTDELTAAYDTGLAEQQGGDWHAGRPRQAGERLVETYEFVRSQHDLVQHVLTLHRLGKLGEPTIYDTIALINKRLDTFRAQTSDDAITSPDIFASPFRNLYDELQTAGREARVAGQTFSACGVSIGSGEGTSAEGQLNGAGYGNKATETCEFTSKKCPICKNKNVRTKRTATRIVDLDYGCVRKL